MLGIFAISLVPLAVFNLFWISQHNGEVILQDVEHRNPVRPRALHDDVGDAFPFIAVESTGHGADGTLHRIGISFRISSIGRTAEIFPAFGLIFHPQGGILRDLTAVISFDDMECEIDPPDSQPRRTAKGFLNVRHLKVI